MQGMGIGTLVKVIEFGERSHDVLEFDIGR
jgi:hypothetical protein